MKVKGVSPEQFWSWDDNRQAEFLIYLLKHKPHDYFTFSRNNR